MPAAQRRAGLPWQRAPPSTCAEERAFLAGPFEGRFGALAVQLAPARGADRSVADRGYAVRGFLVSGCIVLPYCCAPNASLCFHHPCFIFFWCSVPCFVRMPSHVPNAARLWALSPLQPLQSHPACASYSRYSLRSERQLVPAWSGAIYMLMSCLASLQRHTFLRASQELCTLGFASLLAARQVKFTLLSVVGSRTSSSGDRAEP